jgi:hypothetical protein
MASATSTAVFAVVAKDAASGVMRGIGKQMGSLGKTGGAVFKSIAAGAAIAAAAITTAFGLAAKFAKTAIQAAIEDDAEQQKLIATLKARGLTTEQATKRTNELISAGQKLAFTDSETRKGIGIASQFTKNYAKQTAILTAAQNLARARNISLEKATKLVGNAFAGNGKALKAYGIDLTKTGTVTTRVQKITKDGAIWETQTKQINGTVKGLEAVNLITEKNAGVAAAYAKTFAGQFDQVRDSINETVEAIGVAIGGGEGLPTFTRLLEGIRPVLDDLLGEINANLPNIQRFTRELVEKFLAKLPGYVATAKRELPILIDKATQFIGSVAGFGKELATFLGPDGLVTAGIAGLGFKFGGLGGAAGAVFASEFIKLGVDPITASITGTIAGALTAGVVQGLGSALAQAAITKFLGLFKSIPVTPSIPVTLPGGGTPPAVPVPGGGGISGIVKTVLTVLGGLGIAFTAQTALQDQAVGAMKKGQDPLWKTLTMPWTWPGAVGDILRGGPELTTPIAKGVTTGMESMKAALLGRDINFSNETTLILDGAVVAKSVNKHLGLTAANLSPQRVYPRNR